MCFKREAAPNGRIGQEVPFGKRVVSLGSERSRPSTFNIDKIREARVPSWACSPAAVERDLDFAPPRAIADRLVETIRWYHENGWL